MAELGPVYLDTDGLLDLVTPMSPQDRTDLHEISLALDEGGLAFVTSELTILESLVHAVRTGDRNRETLLRRFLTPGSFVATVPVTLDIIEDALLLRANFNLRTPDAIHVASGMQAGCRVFLSKDAKWRRAGATLVSPAQLASRLRDQQAL